MNEVLRECPFCGSNNIIFMDSSNEVDEKAWCVECQANIPRFKGRREELIQAWNRRTQPDNPPLSLEQLRGMGGEPVWIEDLEEPENSEWKICYWDRGKYLVLTSMHCQGHLLDEYGKTWLAYAHKPEKDGDEG